MPVFSYRARGSHGDAIDGTIEANGTDAAAASLIESGLTPIDIQPYVENESVAGNLELMLFSKIENEDLIQFCRQMHSLLRAGVPVFRAVTGLATASGNAMLKSTLHEVMDALESGRTLSDALDRHPKIFSNFFVSLVRVGETTGNLEEIFRQLAFYLDRDHATRAKIKSALRYPCIVLAAIGVALAVMTIWVIPSFSNLFDSFGSELPLPTRVLMLVSAFMVTWWPALLGALALFDLAQRGRLQRATVVGGAALGALRPAIIMTAVAPAMQRRPTVLLLRRAGAEGAVSVWNMALSSVRTTRWLNDEFI